MLQVFADVGCVEAHPRCGCTTPPTGRQSQPKDDRLGLFRSLNPNEFPFEPDGSDERRPTRNVRRKGGSNPDRTPVRVQCRKKQTRIVERGSRDPSGRSDPSLGGCVCLRKGCKCTTPRQELQVRPGCVWGPERGVHVDVTTNAHRHRHGPRLESGGRMHVARRRPTHVHDSSEQETRGSGGRFTWIRA